MPNRFWVGGSGDWDDTAHWSTTTGPTGNPPQSVPGNNDPAIFDANSGGGGTGVVTITGTHTVGNLSCGAWPGTMDFTGSTSFTIFSTGQFGNNGTATRTFKMGSGTITADTFAVAGTGLTTIPGTAIVQLGTAGTGDKLLFIDANCIPYMVVFGPNASIASCGLVGTHTMTNAKFVGPTRVRFPAGNSIVATNVICQETKGQPVELRCIGSTNGVVSVAAGTVEFNWAAMRGIDFTGGATFKATNSFDLGLNTGITISPPTSGLVIGG